MVNRNYLNEGLEPGSDEDDRELRRSYDKFSKYLMSTIKGVRDDCTLDIDFDVPSHAYNKKYPHENGMFRVQMSDGELYAGFLNRRKKYELKQVKFSQLQAIIDSVLDDMEQYAEEESYNNNEPISKAFNDIINNVDIGKVMRGSRGYESEFESYSRRSSHRRHSRLNEAMLNPGDKLYDDTYNKLKKVFKSGNINLTMSVMSDKPANSIDDKSVLTNLTVYQDDLEFKFFAGTVMVTIAKPGYVIAERDLGKLSKSIDWVAKNYKDIVDFADKYMYFKMGK